MVWNLSCSHTSHQTKLARLKNVDPVHCRDSERENETRKDYSNAAVFSFVLMTTEHLGYCSKTTVGYLGFYKLYLQRGASESLYSGNHSVKE